MTQDGSKRPILGYVSAYLKQPLRTLAEAEQDTDASRSDSESTESQRGLIVTRKSQKAPRL